MQPKRAVKDVCAALPADLNPSQRAAIQLAMQRTLTLWQGPPGSGKTHTLACCLAAMTKLTKGTCVHILACAGSNVAVDNLVEALLRRGVRVVRVGQPTRIPPGLQKTSLDHLAAIHASGACTTPLACAGFAASGLFDCMSDTSMCTWQSIRQAWPRNVEIDTD